jgi:hypothetical protein
MVALPDAEDLVDEGLADSLDFFEVEDDLAELFGPAQQASFRVVERVVHHLCEAMTQDASDVASQGRGKQWLDVVAPETVFSRASRSMNKRRLGLEPKSEFSRR